MRAEQVLPDNINQVSLDGVMLRKGTVAAFLANARVWCDSHASDAARAEAETDMLDALPALHLLGLFEVLEIREPALREWVRARHQPGASSATGGEVQS
ncbi:hypothetical protein LFL96_21970 [Paraburkholderia sp. D15]|uniref:hypothetical protein n=1 Tax=Paraburkholderia sp. D15 TaxID=2880218 RepID=UPI002478CEB6|nr:hypothetical protein [Paraburkholderia sp. D15]WGS53715.1 hypothetical protein LFL96_21970 [Paraburkholderia sp. D15]